MQKNVFLLLFCLCLSFFGRGQYEFINGKFPYKEAIEWPGKGSLFIGDDPTGKTLEINLSLFNNEGEIDWTRSVYPKEKGTHLILSDHSDYLYFVDNFEPINNAIRYNQINRSGSVIPTKLDVLNIIRSYNYRNPKDLILRDIVNTPKALVFYFQLPVPEEKILENFFIAITHHNNRVYHCKAPASNAEYMKKYTEGHFIYSGANEETISFSRYGASNSLEFFSISPKAQILTGHTYKIPNENPLLSNLYFTALNGSYYLENEKRQTVVSNGRGLYIEGYFYYVCNDAKEGVLKIYKRNEEGNMEESYSSPAPSKIAKRNTGALTFMQFKGKVVIISNINGQLHGVEIENHAIKEINPNAISTEKRIKNPSAIFVKESNGKFIHFIGKEAFFIEDGNLTEDIITFKKL